MGCTSSKSTTAMNATPDDSIHACLKSDYTKCKSAGKVPQYRPRDSHPIVDKDEKGEVDQVHHSYGTDSSSSGHFGVVDDADIYPEENARRLILHAKYHCDTIDPRDASAKRVYTVG